MEITELVNNFLNETKAEMNTRIVAHLTNNPSADLNTFLLEDKNISKFNRLSNLLTEFKMTLTKENGFTPIQPTSSELISPPQELLFNESKTGEPISAEEPHIETMINSEPVSESTDIPVTMPVEESVKESVEETSVSAQTPEITAPDFTTCTISRFKADKDEITVYVYPLSTREEGKNAKILVEILWKNRYHGFSSYDRREDGNVIVQARVGEYLITVSAFYADNGLLQVNIVPMEGILIPISTETKPVTDIYACDYNSIYGDGKIIAFKSPEDDEEYATAVFNTEFCDYNHLTKSKPFAWIIEDDNRIKYEVADSQIILE